MDIMALLVCSLTLHFLYFKGFYGWCSIVLVYERRLWGFRVDFKSFMICNFMDL